MARNKRVEWYPAGVEFDSEPLVLLSPGGWSHQVLKGIGGFDMPVFDFASIRGAGVDGVRFGDVTATRPTLTLPILVRARSRSELRRAKSEIAQALNPKAGAGRLVLSEDVGTNAGAVRYVDAIYRSGLEGDSSSGGTETWWQPTIQFECSDPYWYSPEPAVAVWSGRVGHPFFPFTFPWSLSPYGVDASEPLEYEGDAESWPTVRLTGPWSRVRFTHDGSGRWWEVSRDASELEPLVVRMKPSEPRVRTVDGVNRYRLWHPKSQAFSISRGDSVSVEVDGAESSTRIELEAPVTWLTAP